MAFSAGKNDERSLDRSDLDLLWNDPCFRHITQTKVSGPPQAHVFYGSGVVDAKGARELHGRQAQLRMWLEVPEAIS